MLQSRPVLLGIALAATLLLAGCAPASSGSGAGGTSPQSSAPAHSASGKALRVIDICKGVPVSSMASLLGRPYAEVHNDRTTAASSICDYEGVGGDASRLDLNVTMQSGATRADVDKILSNLVEDGEHPVQISGMGDYASAAKDVVAALYGSTVIVAIDSNEPDGTPDLTTAELRQVVKAVVAATR